MTAQQLAIAIVFVLTMFCGLNTPFILPQLTHGPKRTIWENLFWIVVGGYFGAMMAMFLIIAAVTLYNVGLWAYVHFPK
jgi:hypothetical protein